MAVSTYVLFQGREAQLWTIRITRAFRAALDQRERAPCKYRRPQTMQRGAGREDGGIVLHLIKTDDYCFRTLFLTIVASPVH